MVALRTLTNVSEPRRDENARRADCEDDGGADHEKACARGRLDRPAGRWELAVFAATRSRPWDWPASSPCAVRADSCRVVTDERARGGGTLRAPQPGTLADYLTAWLRDDVEPNRAANTHALYKSVVEKHILPGVGNIRVDAFDAHAVVRLYARLRANGASPSIVHRSGVILHRALEVRRRQTGISNPAAQVEVPRYRSREGRVLSRDEAAHLVVEIRKSKDDPLAPMWELALHTALRLGELLGLQWSDVNERQRELHVRRQLVEVNGSVETTAPKTRMSARVVPLSKAATAALRRRRGAWEREGHKSEHIFTTSIGTHPRRSNLRRDSFAPLCERAKIEGLTIHGLRRSAATLLVQQGVDVVTVARMLGETRPATALQHYVFTSPDQQRRAVAALDSALRAPRRRAP